MLDSLEIKNYRNLKDLIIKTLGRVNLLTGKNNTGKSTLLEAVAIYASKGDINVILELLEERGEYNRRSKNENKSVTESNIKSFASLFNDRKIKDENENPLLISIGSIKLIENDVNSQPKNDKTFSMGFLMEKEPMNSRTLDMKRRNHYKIDDQKIEVIYGNEYYILPLKEENLYDFFSMTNFQSDSFQFIKTRNIFREINGKLWDKIIFTDKENSVIEALKIIEPTTERIAFVEENLRNRAAVIKLSGSQQILPLLSMGDGINRILTIILAMVNSENGYLLIDEFENGLHHSVQEKLWEIIFTLSQKLNVQVFATTHSEDCISGFEAVLNKNGNSKNGKLIRLEDINGQIKQVEFDANELKIANENDIEIR